MTRRISISRCSLILFSLLVCCGCVHENDWSGLSEGQKTPNRIHSLKQFEGTFSNSPQRQGPGLAWIIFTNAPTHVDVISSKVLDKSHIQIQAIYQGQVVREEILQLGKDFKVSASRIPVGSEVKTKTGTGGYYLPVAGTGVAVMRGNLFLNKDGDLIYQKSNQAVGLLFFIVPVVGDESQYSLYKRLK